MAIFSLLSRSSEVLKRRTIQCSILEVWTSAIVCMDKSEVRLTLVMLDIYGYIESSRIRGIHGKKAAVKL
jgi:hypothetical protein